MAKTKRQKEAPKLEKASLKKRAYVSQTDIPRYSLEEALSVPMAICNNYGKHPTRPLHIAQALDLAPKGSHFRMLCGSAIAYGLADGGYNAETISLSDLGRRICAPTQEGDDRAARREAFMKPRVIRDFMTKYNASKIPAQNIARNVLEEMGVPKDAAERTYRLILDTAKELGMLQDVKNQLYVDLSGVHVTVGTTDEAAAPEVETEVGEQVAKKSTTAEKTQMQTRPIFVGHGKKKKPREKLINILDTFKIPYKFAVDEPHLGRPISQKVRETMQDCGSAILIFTCDERFQDEKGEEVWRPSENVIYELGAASYAYEDRVVIFKEKGIHFPTNFENIGYIEFEEDRLEEKTTELLKELIGFKLVTITPA